MSKKKINYLADAVTLVEEDLSDGRGIDLVASQVMECLRDKVSPELHQLFMQMLLGLDSEMQLVVADNLLDFACDHVVHTTNCLTVDVILKQCYCWIAEQQGFEHDDAEDTLLGEWVLTADDFVRNERGTRVKKACFSCKHMEYDFEKGDVCCCCRLDKKEHSRCDLCKWWRMRQGLKKAGISSTGGSGQDKGVKIKRREYLEYLTAIRAEETKGEPRDTESIRKEFEDLYGPAFINF